MLAKFKPHNLKHVAVCVGSLCIVGCSSIGVNNSNCSHNSSSADTIVISCLKKTANIALASTDKYVVSVCPNGHDVIIDPRIETIIGSVDIMVNGVPVAVETRDFLSSLTVRCDK